MPIEYVASAKRSTNGGANQTDTMESTTATLLLYGGNEQDTTLSMTDGKGNTPITALTSVYNNTMAEYLVSGYFNSDAPAVGSGHYAGTAFFYYGGVIAAFKGTAAAPFDGQQSGASADSVTSLTTGSVTPSVGGCLIYTTLAIGADRTVTEPAGYVMMQTQGAAGVSPIYVAYKIKGANDTSAENPSWSWTGGAAHAMVKVAVFKPAGSSTSGANATYYISLIGRN